jgi:ferritin-like metal-binding protein YciE
MIRRGLWELLIDELKDCWMVENRLVKTLPKPAEASISEELRSDFEEHLGQTLEHVDRLRKILRQEDARYGLTAAPRSVCKFSLAKRFSGSSSNA